MLPFVPLPFSGDWLRTYHFRYVFKSPIQNYINQYLLRFLLNMLYSSYSLDFHSNIIRRTCFVAFHYLLTVLGKVHLYGQMPKHTYVYSTRFILSVTFFYTTFYTFVIQFLLVQVTCLIYIPRATLRRYCLMHRVSILQGLAQ